MHVIDRSLLLLATILCFFNGDVGSDLARKPNFVFIIKDDQDLLLQGSIGMEYTADMMAREGAPLTNFYANTPICCPSRATLLSDQHAHRWHTTKPDSCMFMNLRGP